MKRQLSGLLFALALALSPTVACDDGATDQNCSSAYACVNGACGCGSDGTGAVCVNPSDTTADDSQSCDNMCKVCN